MATKWINEATKRSDIELTPSIRDKLKAKAKRARMTFKPYCEEVLINHALSEQVITKEI